MRHIASISHSRAGNTVNTRRPRQSSSSPLARALRFVRALALSALVIGSLFACTAPQDALAPLTNNALGDQSVKEVVSEEPTPDKGAKEKKKGTDSTAAEGSKPAKENASESDAGAETPTAAIDVERVTSNIHRAERALAANYANILAREPLAFDSSVIQLIWDDTMRGWSTLTMAQEAVDTISLPRIALGFVPLLAALLCIILLTLLDRQFSTVAHTAQARRHMRLSSAMTLASRTGLLIAGQLFTPLIILALTYFPIRAIFGEETWTLLLTDTLWLILFYRMATSTLETLLGLPWLDLKDEHARRLRTVLLRLLDVAAITFHLLTAARIFSPRPEIFALTIFVFNLIVATLPIGLLTLRTSIMALFPDQQDGSLYVVLLRWLARNYFWLLGLTVVLLTMRAFGYQYAARFILTRGYGLLFLTMGFLFGTSKLHGLFERRIQGLDSQDPQRELLQSIKRLLTSATLFVVAMIAARLLAIIGPLVLVLKTPLLTVQGVEFSLFNILSAVIIVGGATLVSKIVRALLNAKVYPALGVEVGVAYAVNTIISYAIVVVGFFMVLIALGVNLSALTVVIASLSVGIGFGLQTLTENLISGFIILFGRAVRKGDYITVGEVYGRVEAVGARSVVVRTMDNYDLLIPSKDLVGGTIINWTYRDSIVRLHIPVGVTYNAEPRVVEKILCEAAHQHQFVLNKPAPEVWFVGFGDSAINFELLLYYDCRKIMADRLKGELYYHIWDALAAQDIEIPFPQQDLHLRSANLDGLERLLASQRRGDKDQKDNE